MDVKELLKQLIFYLDPKLIDPIILFIFNTLSIESAFFENKPRYLYSKVSGLVIAGNFIPINLGFFKKLSNYSGVNLPRTFYITYN